MSGRLTEPGQGFELQFCRESGCEYYGEPEGCNHPNYVCPSNCYFTTVAERLQEYEDAEEQGLFVKLPCKVGDTVYDTINDKLIPCTVDRISISSDRIEIHVISQEGKEYGFPNYEFGKTVFLTREEAVAALKGADE